MAAQLDESTIMNKENFSNDINATGYVLSVDGEISEITSEFFQSEFYQMNKNKFLIKYLVEYNTDANYDDAIWKLYNMIIDNIQLQPITHIKSFKDLYSLLLLCKKNNMEQHIIEQALDKFKINEAWLSINDPEYVFMVQLDFSWAINIKEFFAYKKNPYQHAIEFDSLPEIKISPERYLDAKSLLLRIYKGEFENNIAPEFDLQGNRAPLRHENPFAEERNLDDIEKTRNS